VGKLVPVAVFVGSLLALGDFASAQSSGGIPGGMMGRLSPEDLSAFVDAHIAALKVGLKLTAEQEKLWPPVEDAMRNLANLHLTHMQAMRQGRGMTADDPVDLLRSIAGRMSQGADATRKLADASAPLYATLDDVRSGGFSYSSGSEPAA
jgi:LTXXQ motif family protein